MGDRAVTLSRTVTVDLQDGGGLGTFWTATHAITVAIKYHKGALAGIDRNKGVTAASTNARQTHSEAIVRLEDLTHLLYSARAETINKENP